jgi:hypothetical protein
VGSVLGAEDPEVEGATGREGEISLVT